MDDSQRAAVLGLLRLRDDVPEHGLRAEGVAYVSGPLRRQRISYAVPGGARLTAWLLRPSSGSGPWPGVIALHPHGDRFDLGGDEVAGQAGQREHHYGATLAERGFAVLCPDLPGFGMQRGPTGLPGHRWEELLLSRELVEGRSLLALTLDQLRAAVGALLDYQQTSDLTVSVLGYGMGARAAAWLTFVDQRVGAVWLHAGVGQQRVLLAQNRLLPRHTLLPGLLALGLDQADVIAALLPRAVGISYGRRDAVALPAAVAPVIAALHARQELLPGSKIAVLDGDYDHRFPLEVQQAIADQLLAWR